MDGPKFVQITGEKDFAARPRTTAPSLGYAGLKRNVAVALGNAGERGALVVLWKALDDEEPLVREHAAWAIEEIEGRAAAARPSRSP